MISIKIRIEPGCQGYIIIKIYEIKKKISDIYIEMNLFPNLSDKIPYNGVPK